MISNKLFYFLGVFSLPDSFEGGSLEAFEEIVSRHQRGEGDLKEKPGGKSWGESGVMEEFDKHYSALKEKEVICLSSSCLFAVWDGDEWI